MQVYPAIDLRNGKCVRLKQGDFKQLTTYCDDPLEMAKRFEQQGAKWLHVVDLDGAKGEKSTHIQSIANIIKDTQLKIQTGGGVRSVEDIKNRLEIGVQRVIVGTQAIKQPLFMQDCLNQFGPDQIVLAVDVKIEKNNIAYVTYDGWQKTSELSLTDFIDQFLNAGLKHILCTDISRDGMLAGPNFNLYQNLKAKYPSLCLQASGGVASMDDVQKLREAKIDGVIIGKALYENRFKLEAILC